VRWQVGADRTLDEDLVAATLLCDATGRVPDGRHFVFFNQLSSPEASVEQLRVLVGDDCEQIEVDLPAVPAGIDRVVVMLYVNEGPSGRHRTLRGLRSCVIRIVNPDDGVELIRSEDLAPPLSSETAVVLGELYRHRTGWKFRVIGQGYDEGLRGVAADYGIPL
jgi:tellurium resistance protein TerD